LFESHKGCDQGLSTTHHHQDTRKTQEKETTMLRKSLFSIAILMLVSATAGAQQFEKMDTYVRGDIDIEVDVDDVTTKAGHGANAETDIGTINEGSYLLGNVDIDVEAKDVTTEAAARSNACTSIGTVGGGCVNDETPFFKRHRKGKGRP
jgi:hypothetical protein